MRTASPPAPAPSTPPVARPWSLWTDPSFVVADPIATGGVRILSMRDLLVSDLPVAALRIPGRLMAPALRMLGSMAGVLLSCAPTGGPVRLVDRISAAGADPDADAIMRSVTTIAGDPTAHWPELRAHAAMNGWTPAPMFQTRGVGSTATALPVSSLQFDGESRERVPAATAVGHPDRAILCPGCAAIAFASANEHQRLSKGKALVNSYTRTSCMTAALSASGRIAESIALHVVAMVDPASTIACDPPADADHVAGPIHAGLRRPDPTAMRLAPWLCGRPIAQTTDVVAWFDDCRSALGRILFSPSEQDLLWSTDAADVAKPCACCGHMAADGAPVAIGWRRGTSPEKPKSTAPKRKGVLVTGYPSMAAWRTPFTSLPVASEYPAERQPVQSGSGIGRILLEGSRWTRASLCSDGTMSSIAVEVPLAKAIADGRDSGCIDDAERAALILHDGVIYGKASQSLASGMSPGMGLRDCIGLDIRDRVKLVVEHHRAALIAVGVAVMICTGRPDAELIVAVDGSGPSKKPIVDAIDDVLTRGTHAFDAGRLLPMAIGAGKREAPAVEIILRIGRDLESIAAGWLAAPDREESLEDRAARVRSERRAVAAIVRRRVAEHLPAWHAAEKALHHVSKMKRRHTAISHLCGSDEDMPPAAIWIATASAVVDRIVAIQLQTEET